MLPTPQPSTEPLPSHPASLPPSLSLPPPFLQLPPTPPRRSSAVAATKAISRSLKDRSASPEDTSRAKRRKRNPNPNISPTSEKKILPAPAPSSTCLTNPATTSTASTTTVTKKSESTSTTRAKKKLARKTAHSLIERRRRGRINEEFDKLRQLVPGCQGAGTGKEMHKLEVLERTVKFVEGMKKWAEERGWENRNWDGEAVCTEKDVDQGASMECDDSEDDGMQLSVEDIRCEANTPATVTVGGLQTPGQELPSRTSCSPTINPTTTNNKPQHVSSPQPVHPSTPPLRSDTSTSHPVPQHPVAGDEEEALLLLGLGRQWSDTGSSVSRSSRGASRRISVGDLLSG